MLWKKIIAGPFAWQRIASSGHVRCVCQRSRSQLPPLDCPLQFLKNGKGKCAPGLGAALPGPTYELCGAAAAAAARDVPPSGAARDVPPSAWALPAASRLPRSRWVSTLRTETRVHSKKTKSLIVELKKEQNKRQKKTFSTVQTILKGPIFYNFFTIDRPNESFLCFI